MKSSLILVLLFCVSASFAAVCLQTVKPASQKASCGSTGCLQGLYCDKAALCAPRLAAGASCNDRDGCVFGTTCKGADNAKICVKNANPGQDCSSSDSDSIPACGDPLNCNFATKKCVGGNLGDKCTDGKDCSTLVCTGGVCAASTINATCSGSTCGADLYCAFQTETLSYRCTPRVATNGVCTSNDMCSQTTPQYCARKNADDVDQVCIPAKSLNVGDLCGSNHDLCKSGICNGYCAEKYPSKCYNRQTCGSAEVCMCGSGLLYEGTGSCTANKCSKKSQALSDCLFSKCQVYSPVFQTFGAGYLFSYENSCATINCQSEWADAVKCSNDEYGFDIEFIDL